MKKLLIVLMLVIITCPLMADDWKLYKDWDDMVPKDITYASNHYTLTFESGAWFIMPESHVVEGGLKGFHLGNSVGDIYIKQIDDGHRYKWVRNKVKSAAMKKAKKDASPAKKITQPQKIEVVKVVKMETNTWVNTNIKLPPKDKVVLVKYKDGLLTTAYLDKKNEWRLNTDRNKLFGGEAITVIVKWKLMGE